MKIDIKNIHDGPLISRAIVIGMFCAAFFYLGYYWDLSSLREELVTAQQGEPDLKKQVEIAIGTQGKVKRDISQFIQLEGLLNQWQQRLIAYSQLPELLNEILKLGALYNLHFSLFNPGNSIKEGPYFKLPIKVVVVGSYHELGQFISRVANMPWIVVIGDMSMTKENRNDVLGAKLAQEALAENLLTAQLTLEVYYIADK